MICKKHNTPHVINSRNVLKGNSILASISIAALIVLDCTDLSLDMSNELIPVQAQVTWMQGTVIVNPVEVDSVRLTILSQCDGVPVSKTFPFSDNHGALQIRTGHNFMLRCEGLGKRGLVLYKGEIRDIQAIGASVSVRITAAICTPAPPDSLNATPAGRKIRLTWKDYANNETGFIIMRSLGNEFKYHTLDTVSTSSFVDMVEIVRGMPYSYLVYSYNDIGLSVLPDSLIGFSLGSNNAPEFVTVVTDLDSTAVVDSVYCDTLHYRDPDLGDSLNCVLDTFPAGVTLKDSIITWIPHVLQEGSTVFIRAIVNDQDSTRDTLQWKIAVKDTVVTDLPPTFTTTTLDMNSVLRIGTLFVDTVLASDPERSLIVYVKLNGPVTAIVDSTSGIVSWQADILGLHQFAVIARDNSRREDTLSWTVNVLAGN